MLSLTLHRVLQTCPPAPTSPGFFQRPQVSGRAGPRRRFYFQPNPNRGGAPWRPPPPQVPRGTGRSDEDSGSGVPAGVRPGRSLQALGLVDWLRLRSCLSRIEPFPLRRRDLSPLPPIGFRDSAPNRGTSGDAPPSSPSRRRPRLPGRGVPRSLPGVTPRLRAAIGQPRRGTSGAQVLGFLAEGRRWSPAPRPALGFSCGCCCPCLVRPAPAVLAP